MMKDLQKLMEKKGKPVKDENYKKAKMSMLQSLKDDMSGMAGDDMKKVTVASDSAHGLREGMKKAEDVISKLEHESVPAEEQEDKSMEGNMGRVADPYLDDKEDAADAGADESSEGEDDDMSPEELDAMIEHLKKKKDQKLSKKG